MRISRLILVAWLCMFPVIRGLGENTISMDAASREGSSTELVLTNVAGCLNEMRGGSDQTRPLRLVATVTLVDRERNLVVLQDDSTAMAVYLASNNVPLAPGERVLVQGSDVLPCVRAFPAFPDEPSERSYLSSFESPFDPSTYFLARVRGYLHPSVTGKYTFWIASDDAGELYLGTNAAPESKQLIAENMIGNSTRPRQWDSYSTQRSEPVTLQAGGNYYIEALHIQNYGSNNLAVAWQGPGIERSVIDGRYLTPWMNFADENAGLPANGLLRECWKNFFVSDFKALHFQDTNESFARIHSLSLTKVGAEGLPVPVRITSDTSLGDISNLSWVELEGEVTFAAGTQDGCQLELKHGDATIHTTVLNWSGFPVERLIHSRVRVRGVLVHNYGSDGKMNNSLIWVPGSQQISTLALGDNQAADLDQVPICEIQTSNPLMNWGRQVTVRGRIIHQTTNGLVMLEGGDNYQGFYSTDGTNWISLGRPVELSMSNSVMAGLAVSSHSLIDPAVASFRNLQGWGTDWDSVDIGSPAHPGLLSTSNDVTIVKGVGTDIGANRDQQFFAFQQLENEVEISAKLIDLQQTSSHAQAGLMIRESLSRRAPYAAILYTPIGGTVFQYRRALGDYSAVLRTGTPVYRRYCWLKLVKRKSLLLVQGNPGPDLHTNQEVDVSGIITWENDTPVLDKALFRGSQPDALSVQSTLDETQQDISIADYVAKVEHPPETYLSRNVRALNLQGVVTFCGQVMGKQYLFIQGLNDGGIQVSWPDARLRPNLEVGQSVEMNGQAPVRLFPVVFGPMKLQVTGWSPLPEPARYASELLKSDSAQARWVEATGVVRSMQPDGLLQLMTSEGLLSVWVGGGQGMDKEQYVDAAVRVRGVLSFDAARSARLLVPGPEFVAMLEIPPMDPFAVPQFTIAELARLDVKPEQLRRMKLSGVITCSLPQGFYVQDSTGGAFVYTDQTNLFSLGDRIEAVGYLEHDSTGVTFDRAEIRKVGVSSLPAPADLDATNIEKNSHAGELVGLKAMLLDRHKTWGGQVLVLQVGTKIIEATLLGDSSEQLLEPAIGSRVAVTGVCQVGQGMPKDSPLADAAPSLVTLKLWLRSPADVVVLERPPWWTLGRIAWISSVLTLGLLGALIWVRILRKRVALRSRELLATMRQLEKEARASALLAERDRLAGEIHDSLEQGLTAIMMQLDAAEKHVEKSPEARTILHRARNMAEFSRAEIQHAVWDLSSPLLENADLATAIKHVAGQISFGSPEVKIEVKGSSRLLPSSHEHHLLRMVQEAITNAVKHARARTIMVTLDYTGPDLKVTVEDDGTGFDPGAVRSGSQGGHFGLQGMRARAQKMGASLDVASQVGKGTVITIRLKMDGEALHSNGTK